ncbi:type II secretion system GspH family protein [Candidatus Parcubacteria bacterium]|nr:type II secretion system GspH family protein [Candidatus Parcubacteria bacterium]
MTIRYFLTARRRGFSLVEIVVYIAILTFLSMIIMNTFATVTHLGTVETGRESSTRSAVAVLNRLSRSIRSAGSASVEGGELLLDGNPVDLSAYLEDGMTLDGLSFNLTSGSTSARVRTSFTLHGESFYSTSVLRHKR